MGLLCCGCGYGYYSYFPQFHQLTQNNSHYLKINSNKWCQEEEGWEKDTLHRALGLTVWPLEWATLFYLWSYLI